MGKKKSQQQLTPLELQIMNVLWDLGPANVQAVQEKLAKSQELAYTTVQTMLNVLHRKGKVRRTLRGRAPITQPIDEVDNRRGQITGENEVPMH